MALVTAGAVVIQGEFSFVHFFEQFTMADESGRTSRATFCDSGRRGRTRSSLVRQPQPTCLLGFL
jgi:hypothetical protein